MENPRTTPRPFTIVVVDHTGLVRGCRGGCAERLRAAIRGRFFETNTVGRLEPSRLGDLLRPFGEAEDPADLGRRGPPFLDREAGPAPSADHPGPEGLAFHGS